MPSLNRIGFSLSNEQTDLSFIDNQLINHTFGLSSVLAEGFNWVDICIQVSKEYIVQADCRLGNNEKIPNDPENIMFQPIFLPECNLGIETIGKNIHNRGFFSWWSGSRHLSLMGICDYCRKSFRLSISDTGWAPEVYYYCKKGIHTLLARPDRKFRLDDTSTHQELESKLPLCNKCDSKFRINNPFRCVHCGKPYLDLESFPEERKERYALSLYGDEYQRFDYYQQS